MIGTGKDRISINHPGQCVRVWEGGKNAKQTYFSASDYGSLYSAFIAAVAYEASLPDDCRYGRKKPRKEATERSQTGVVGVSPLKDRAGQECGYRAAWVEYDKKENPIYKEKSFYFSTVGSNALRMACECRWAMVGK